MAKNFVVPHKSKKLERRDSAVISHMPQIEVADAVDQVRGLFGPDPPPVVIADNTSETTQNVKWYWLLMQVPSVILSIFLYLLFIELLELVGESEPVKWALIGTLACFGIFVAFMSYVTVLVSSGNWQTTLQIKSSVKVQRQRDEIVAEAHSERVQAMTLYEQHRHIEEMARIEASKREAQLEQKNSQLVDTLKLEQYKLRMKGNVVESASEYLPERQEQDRVRDEANGLKAKVNEFFFGLNGAYLVDGNINPEAVQDNGYFVGRVPWSNKGLWSLEESRRFIDAMSTLEKTTDRPLVIQHPTSKRFYLNEADYPSRLDAEQVIEDVFR